MRLNHFWFEFDLPPDGAERGMESRCGVSAFGRDDAQHLLREIVFAGQSLPPVRRCVEGVTQDTLDQIGVGPSHRPLKWRGIWYPLGYSAYNSLVPEKGRPPR